MNYNCKIPVTRLMPPSSYIVRDKGMESKEEEALWHYNRSRAHDGLPPVGVLPLGTEFVPIEE
jgi:hypothetical protein